jgi:hypothetical protein
MGGDPVNASTACRLLDQVHAAGGELAPSADGGLIWAVVPDPDDRLALEEAIRQCFPEIAALVTPWQCWACSRQAELPDLCTSCHLAIAAHTAAGGSFVAGRNCHHAWMSGSTTACGLIVAPDERRVPSRTVRESGGVCRRCLSTLVRRHHRRVA